MKAKLFVEPFAPYIRECHAAVYRFNPLQSQKFNQRGVKPLANSL